MGVPNKALRDWLRTVSVEQARQVAKAAKTSVPHLRHIAKGRRRASAELAQRLERASRALRNPVLVLPQVKLCRACGQCPLAEALLK